MNVTAYDIAKNFLGIKEIEGPANNPMVVAMHQVGAGATWISNDEEAWCSSFVGFICFCLGLKRTMSARARSWLFVGEPVELRNAVVGFDVVIVSRGEGEQPGPEYLNAPGHVGFYAGHDGDFVSLLAGNQGNKVSVANFPIKRILGIRRLNP